MWLENVFTQEWVTSCALAIIIFASLWSCNDVSIVFKASKDASIQCSWRKVPIICQQFCRYQWQYKSRMLNYHVCFLRSWPSKPQHRMVFIQGTRFSFHVYTKLLLSTWTTLIKSLQNYFVLIPSGFEIFPDFDLITASRASLSWHPKQNTPSEGLNTIALIQK